MCAYRFRTAYSDFYDYVANYQMEPAPAGNQELQAGLASLMPDANSYSSLYLWLFRQLFYLRLHCDYLTLIESTLCCRIHSVRCNATQPEPHRYPRLPCWSYHADRHRCCRLQRRNHHDNTGNFCLRLQYPYNKHGTRHSSREPGCQKLQMTA